MMIRALRALLAVLILLGRSVPAPAQVGITNIPYASGMTIVATAGSSSVTGTLLETNLVALRIPGGAMGSNGVIQVWLLWTYTNSANAKTLNVRFNQTPGVTASGFVSAVNATTTATSQTLTIIRNANAANAQVGYGGASVTPFGGVTNVPMVGAVNTALDAYVNINATLANASDSVTLQHAYAVVFRAP